VTERRLSYAVVTPVRNEVENLARLANALVAQRLRPREWVIVDTGSTDETPSVAATLAGRERWISTLPLAGEAALERGGPIVRAFEAGVESLRERPDVVVKLDADLTFEPSYFEGLLFRFAEDPRLGMASGTCYELEREEWRQRHVTGTTVWGAARAYRRECLEEVLPLEQRMGWDGVDEFRANARGWTTEVFEDLPFRHHRREGQRDGSARLARYAQGQAARYLGYRFWYLVLRALWHARREPAAVAMIQGYVAAALRRGPRLADAEARSYLRRQQSLRTLPLRAAEAIGRRRRRAV
jgi:glycosyltransferase involved in cell wall biosynthesis